VPSVDRVVVHRVCDGVDPPLLASRRETVEVAVQSETRIGERAADVDRVRFTGRMPALEEMALDTDSPVYEGSAVVLGLRLAAS